MAAMKVGNGFDVGVACGPMINPAAIESIGSLVGGAVAAGATVATGGSAIDGPGFFFEPTVLGGVEPTAPITREEIFGPVAPVIPFEDHDAMIAHANDTEMGLAAYVYTQDLAKAMRTAERLESGMVGINRGTMSDPAAPFGGMKQSGLGREGSSEGIYEFCETQYIARSAIPRSAIQTSAPAVWSNTPRRTSSWAVILSGPSDRFGDVGVEKSLRVSAPATKLSWVNSTPAAVAMARKRPRLPHA